MTLIPPQKCKRCGKVFERTLGQIWYCSNECSIGGYLATHAASSKRSRAKEILFRHTGKEAVRTPTMTPEEEAAWVAQMRGD